MHVLHAALIMIVFCSIQRGKGGRYQLIQSLKDFLQYNDIKLKLELYVDIFIRE